MFLHDKVEIRENFKFQQQLASSKSFMVIFTLSIIKIYRNSNIILVLILDLVNQE